MDILNFISWIRGGRKFTNVDPATTLVPVGVRDNRRDDKYLTGGISVADLAAQIGSIEIPKVITKPLKGDVQTQLDFYQSTEWQQYNPKLFLFRQKGKKRKRLSNDDYINTGSGFVHTTHLDGNGTKFWGGAQNYYSTFGGLPIVRHTEFTLPTYTPYAKFLLSDLGLDPLEWVTVVENITPSCLERVNIDWVTTNGNNTVDVDAVGIANGKPYYQFDVDGPSGQVNYTLYWDTVYNWSAEPSSGFGTGTNDIVSSRTGACPSDTPGTFTIVNSSGEATFTFFTVNPTSNTFQKRQSVAADYVGFNAQQIGTDTNGLGYYFQISGKYKQDGYKGIDCPDACVTQGSDAGFSSQKQKFKVAIVIDNPNPTPDAPYLIGPMSDTFVLRFAQSSLPKFTTDNISRVVIT